MARRRGPRFTSPARKLPWVAHHPRLMQHSHLRFMPLRPSTVPPSRFTITRSRHSPHPRPPVCAPVTIILQVEGQPFQDLLVAALKLVTRRVMLADQSVEYLLKDSA